MSTAIVTDIGSLRATPLPPIVMRRIAVFIASGNTGKIVLNVKCGIVRSIEVVEVVDANSPLDTSLDDMPRFER